jgi:hypothetical protein
MIVLPDGQVDSDGGLSRAAPPPVIDKRSQRSMTATSTGRTTSVGVLRNRDAAISLAPSEKPPTTTAVVPTPNSPGGLPASAPYGCHQRSFCHGSGCRAMAARTPRTPQGDGLQQGRGPHQQQSGGINDRQASPAPCPIQRRCVGETRKDSEQ